MNLIEETRWRLKQAEMHEAYDLEDYLGRVLEDLESSEEVLRQILRTARHDDALDIADRALRIGASRNWAPKAEE